MAKVCKSLVVDGHVDAQLLGMLYLGLGVEAGGLYVRQGRIQGRSLRIMPVSCLLSDKGIELPRYGREEKHLKLDFGIDFVMPSPKICTFDTDDP